MADDRQLWERICQGDARAFDAFYRENAPRLEAFLRHVVGDRQTAQDLMQETFMQIWRCQTGFGRSAELCARTFTASGGSARWNGGGGKAQEAPSSRTMRRLAGRKWVQQSTKHFSSWRRNNERCCGYAKWKGNRMPSLPTCKPGFPLRFVPQKINRAPNWNWRGVLTSFVICPNG